ncbi:Glyoxalase-like domain-containing protein [Lysobacter sp. yr284]|uniref:VOC family protein n=1 Tax=Lysobacter sp. yr284 TaxID=1761791 RepID=UPI0008942FE5|nr:VOC family protein [Lysobacter sp. yr284]SDY23996.1 Glyoxalase-like domain-containing protein [Lysobacter sp. yr284]
MRLFPRLAAAVATLSLSALALAAPTPRPSAGERLDHALLWGRSLDQITAAMTVKLGFQVAPGRPQGALANRYVRLDGERFIELLGLTGADAPLDPGAQADQAALHGAAGARTLVLHSDALDAARAALLARGLAATPVFSAAPDDPDGTGPGTPPRWSLFAVDPSPLSSRLFYIRYAPVRPDIAADRRSAREHPNGARELSALWLLSADAEADRAQLARLGYDRATPVRLAQIGARGYCVAIGASALLALQPDGAGAAADALAQGGAQIAGISIGVADLERARHLVGRGYERTLERYRGLAGASFLAPSRDDLGLWIEFHARDRATGPCGAAAAGAASANAGR